MRAGVAAEQAARGGPHELSLRRDRQAVKTIAANMLAQALGYGSRFVVIPVSLVLLGQERYGLWLAVGSLVAWGGLLDFGLAPGVVNVVARVSGLGDRTAIRRYLSTALVTYGFLAVLCALLVAGVAQWNGLPALLGIRETSLAGDARLVVVICGFAFAAGVVTRVVPTACTALQEGYFGSWCFVAGSLTSLALLLVLAAVGASLTSYALVMALAPLAAQLALGSYYFGRRHPDLRPSVAHWDLASLRELWGVGGWLMLHQMANVGVLYTANVIIANRLGPRAVPEYSVPYAVFAVMISVAYYVTSPYLPAYAEAATRGDWQWIRRRSSQALAFTAAVLAAGGVALILIGAYAIRLWTSGNLEPERRMLAALACFALVRAVTNTNDILLIGVGAVRFAGCMAFTAAVMFVAGSWVLLPRLGVVAVPIAGAAAYAVHAAVSLPFGYGLVRSGRTRALPARCGAARSYGVG